MRYFLVVVILLMAGCGAKIEVTEHGWKTDRVEATRVEGGMGQTLEFQFPKNINDADGADVANFFKWHGCWIYQGGGYPGAPAEVHCNGVIDRASADAKLMTLVPDLTEMLVNLSNGVHHHETPAEKAIDEDNRKHANDCVPGEDLGANVNNTPYECDKETKQWKVCDECIKVEEKYEAHKTELAVALTTRILTESEMKEVMGMGQYIYSRPMESFYEPDLQNRFTAALQIQMMLRMKKQ